MCSQLLQVSPAFVKLRQLLTSYAAFRAEHERCLHNSSCQRCRRIKVLTRQVQGHLIKIKASPIPSNCMGRVQLGVRNPYSEGIRPVQSYLRAASSNLLAKAAEPWWPMCDTQGLSSFTNYAEPAPPKVKAIDLGAGYCAMTTCCCPGQRSFTTIGHRL